MQFNKLVSLKILIKSGTLVRIEIGKIELHWYFEPDSEVHCQY